jgi:branched-chain amino acid transport system ATP-binding protein
LLDVTDLSVSYGRGGQAVRGASFTLQEGETVVVLGPNGAGKTSLARAIGGFQRHEGVTTRGTVRLRGKDILGRTPDAIGRAGVCVIPERNKIFRTLSVRDNLKIFTERRRDRAGVDDDMEAVFRLFPGLLDLVERPAGLLSGGQQQMLALSGALLARPDLLVVDEPSLGLAPILIKQVMAALDQLRRDTGVALLLADQNVWATIHLADRVFEMSSGELIEERAEDIQARLLERGYTRSRA